MITGRLVVSMSVRPAVTLCFVDLGVGEEA